MTATSLELRRVSGVGFRVALVGIGLVLLVGAVVTARGVVPAAGMLVLLSVAAVGYRTHVRWDVVIAFILLVVLVIPIKRYEFAVDLPFDLEPYRLVIGLLLGIWVAALLVDPRVSLRSSALDGPLILIGLSVIGSVALNPGWITEFNIYSSWVGSDWTNLLRGAEGIPYADVSNDVTKALLFFVSFYLVYYFIVGVVRSPREIHAVVKTLVVVTSGVAFFAIIERRTNFNVFNYLESWVPVIQFQGGLDAEGIERGGRLRVYASAQHPIALAALFAMVLPLSAYLAYQAKRKVWYATSALVALGLLATVSRTGIVMLGASGLVFFFLRRDVLKRLWVLAIPAFVVVHLVMPGTIGSLRTAFFPPEGIVAEQAGFTGRASSGRLGPQFDVIREKPAFGQGYGTRVTTGPEQNSRILDNQWLATAVETGLVGMFAWLWLFVRFIRRAGRAARQDLSERGWLLTALAASVAGFGVAMLTYDAFAFIQATLVFFVLLAIGAATLAYEGKWESPARADAHPDPRRRTGVIPAAPRPSQPVT